MVAVRDSAWQSRRRRAACHDGRRGGSHWSLHAAAVAAGATPEPAPPDGATTAATGPLTARENEVLERIAAGDSNKLIARVLDFSPHTVKRHVANILDELALASRGQAAAWLREHGCGGRNACYAVAG